MAIVTASERIEAELSNALKRLFRKIEEPGHTKTQVF